MMRCDGEEEGGGERGVWHCECRTGRGDGDRDGDLGS